MQQRALGCGRSEAYGPIPRYAKIVRKNSKMIE
jgi:hypothetical protein